MRPVDPRVLDSNGNPKILATSKKVYQVFLNPNRDLTAVPLERRRLMSHTNMISRYSRFYSSLALLGLMLVASPSAPAQGQKVGFFLLVNAVDLASDTVIAMDGKALGGFKPGEATGGLGVLAVLHSLQATLIVNPQRLPFRLIRRRRNRDCLCNRSPERPTGK